MLLSSISRSCAAGDFGGSHWSGFALVAACMLASLLSSCAGTVGGAGSTVSTPVVSVAVSPAVITVATGGTAQFTATVQNAPSEAVQWAVNKVVGGSAAAGTINSNGLYQAPDSVLGAAVEITAALQADTSRFGSAEVTIIAPISLTPRQAALTTSQTLQFQAAGPDSGAGVDWSASAGTITPGGFYTPPPSAGIFTVTATSRSDPTASAPDCNLRAANCTSRSPGMVTVNCLAAGSWRMTPRRWHRLTRSTRCQTASEAESSPRLRWTPREIST
jgi:hypothetical protein